MKAAIFLCLIVVFLPGIASAQLSEDIHIHGFGGWAYAKTNNLNRYLMGNEDGSFDDAYFSLNISANVYDNFSVYVQTAYNEDHFGNEIVLDYAFAEWYIRDELSIRLGKVKAPFLLCTEVYDVGTVRPFYYLPQGIYNDTAAEAFKGIGFTGMFQFDKWELAYDLYGGKLILRPGIFPDMTTLQFTKSGLVANDMMGGRLTLTPPLSGLHLAYSTYKGDVVVSLDNITLEDNPFSGDYFFHGFSLDYNNANIYGRAEYLMEISNDFMDYSAWYAEAAYKVLNHWQLATRIESYEIDRKQMNPDPSANLPATFYEHNDLSFGLNYWVNANMAIKCSYHSISKNRFANPEDFTTYIQSVGLGKFPEEKTNMLVLATQFSF